MGSNVWVCLAGWLAGWLSDCLAVWLSGCLRTRRCRCHQSVGQGIAGWGGLSMTRASRLRGASGVCVGTILVQYTYTPHAPPHPTPHTHTPTHTTPVQSHYLEYYKDHRAYLSHKEEEQVVSASQSLPHDPAKRTHILAFIDLR